MKPLILLISLIIISPAITAATPTSRTVSFKCGYAIAAVIGEMGSQTSNKVLQEALGQLNENNGEFVCLQPGDGKIYIRLQSTEMAANDNKLVFTIDTLSYEIVKTIYGR